MNPSLPILVTGCAGFIGSNVTRILLSKGFRVVGVDSLNNAYDPIAKLNRLSTLQGNPDFSFISGSVDDPNIIEMLFRHELDSVVHLAARAGVRPSVLAPVPYMLDNVSATCRILEQSARLKLRHVVIASSSSVYGNRMEGAFKETDSTDLAESPYAASKKACEVIAHSFFKNFGLPVSLMRFFTVYGPKGRPDMAIDIFAKAIMQDQPITLYGDPNSARDYTFVEDTVDGILRILQKPMGYTVVNLGNDKPVTLAQLVDAFAEVSGKTPTVINAPHRAGDVFRTHADISKARSIYGYDPKTCIKEGIKVVLEDLAAGQ